MKQKGLFNPTPRQKEREMEILQKRTLKELKAKNRALEAEVSNLREALEVVLYLFRENSSRWKSINDTGKEKGKRGK